MTIGDFSVSIVRDRVGVTRAGFGVPLILSATAAFAERIRSYASYNEVLTDFPDVDGPEALSANALFAQTPKPRLVKIGRSALPPTLVYTGSAVAGNLKNSYDYNVHVYGPGMDETVTYTSYASATNDEIV